MSLKYLVLAVLVLTFVASIDFAQTRGSVVVREKKYDVGLNESNSFGLSPVQLDKVVFRDGDSLVEGAQLTFDNFKGSDDALRKNRLILTAYGKDGQVVGIQAWRFRNGPSKEAFSDSPGRISLMLSDDLFGASSYTLDFVAIKPMDAASAADTTCQECVNLANQTCGTGGVQSVKCSRSRDGSESCEFTCRPR